MKFSKEEENFRRNIQRMQHPPDLFRFSNFPEVIFFSIFLVYIFLEKNERRKNLPKRFFLPKIPNSFKNEGIIGITPFGPPNSAFKGLSQISTFWPITDLKKRNFLTRCFFCVVSVSQALKFLMI